MQTQLVDTKSTLVSEVGDLAIKRVQDIPADFLDHLKTERDASSAPAGDFHKACSVPVAVHEMWLRQGFDMMKAPAKEIVARLRREGLDTFITTTKSL